MHPTADGDSEQPQAAPPEITPEITSIEPDPRLTEQLEAQIESQVETLEAESLAAEAAEVQQRVQHLIALIKTSLRSQSLDPKTQRELARLLSLAPKLDGRHIQQLNLLDLAVSILLEPNSLESGADRQTEGAAAKKTGAIARHETAAKNLVFVQETRRQIAQQSRTYPDLLRTIFVPGGGTPYIRLISGLSWFFMVFVVAPLAVAGLTFAARDIAGFTRAKATIEALKGTRDDLVAERSQQEDRIEQLSRRQNALAAQLGRTSSQLAAIGADSTDDTTADAASSAEEGNTEIAPTNGTSQPTTVTVNQQVLRNIRTEIEAELRSNLNRAEETTENSEALASASSEQETPDENENTLRTRPAEAIASADRVFTTNFSLILLAVAMGALGSTISVIVRANTFIRQAEENNNDLFLTGFFRPFVGMSFAIFCVALIEAGIFSGIFDLNSRKDAEDQVYFYVAIAFVAGFSERLVRDVVIKTEDTLAGPAGGRDHWQ